MADRPQPHPWEQLDDEPSPAYQAFMAYRDMGPRRTVVDAYRQRQRKPEAKQADGTWNRWAKRYRWQERALAFDRHPQAVIQQGIDEVNRQSGREFASIRDRHLKEGIERWERRLKQSDLIADMPPVQRTVQQDGKTIVYEAVDVLDRIRALYMAARAQERLFDLIDRGMRIETDVTADQARQQAALRAPGDSSAVGQKLDQFRAAKLAEVISFDWLNPPGPPAPEAAGTDPADVDSASRGRNGSGVPPVPASAT